MNKSHLGPPSRVLPARMTSCPRCCDAGDDGASCLVLVADDYPDAAEVLAEALQIEAGCESVFALDGVQAVSMSLARRPDVAMLDLDMPNMDGIETARSLHTAYGSQRPLLVALTGRESLKEVEDSALFDHIIGKPAEISYLVELLDTR